MPSITQHASAPPAASLPLGEIAYALTVEDVTAFNYHLWQKAPKALPAKVRTFLWLQSIYLAIAMPELIIGAVGGIAVAVYFSVRAACDEAQRAAGRPGQALAVYIVLGSLFLLYGFLPGRFLWRFVAWLIRHFVLTTLRPFSRRGLSHGHFHPDWRYRLTLTGDGPTRVVDMREENGGMVSHLRKTESAPWSAIGSVAATDSHVFLIVHDGPAAFIVPASAFPGPRAFTAFVEEARRLHKVARSPEGSPVARTDRQQRGATESADAGRNTGITIFVESVRQ